MGYVGSLVSHWETRGGKEFNLIHPIRNSLTLYQPMTANAVMTFVNSP